MNIIYDIVEILEVIIPILISVAFLTLAERKILGSIQRRVGPNKIGILGLLQPFADALKLIVKEIIFPQKANKMIFIITPIVILSISLIMWGVIPFSIGYTINDNKLGILFILALSSLSVYSLIYSGWSSNSKYALLGSLRSIAQVISYEVSLGIIIMSIIILSHSLNILQIIKTQIYIYNIIILLPIFLLFFISSLAETNRTPFDLTESESELVAGVHTEYSGILFTSIYLAEYSNILLLSALQSILFFGLYPGSFLTLLILFGFIWVRAALPRIRYDQLLNLAWTKILPFSIAYLILVFSVMLI